MNPNVFVKVVSAYIYKDYDGDGKMDPYVKVKLGNQTFETPIATDMGQKPTWGDKAQFAFFRSKEEKFSCELWEDDTMSSDDLLGTAEIDLAQAQQNQSQGESQYYVYSKGEKVAELNLVIRIDSTVKIDPVKSAKELAQAEQDSKASAEQTKAERKAAQKEKARPNITMSIVSAHIFENYDEGGKMDPYCVIKMGEYTFKTQIAQNQGQDPKWTEGATHGFFRTNEQEIILELWDKDQWSNDDLIGTAVLEVEDLFSEQPKEQQLTVYGNDQQGTAEVIVRYSFDVAVDKPSQPVQQQQQQAQKQNQQQPVQNNSQVQQNNSQVQQNNSQVQKPSNNNNNVNNNSSNINNNSSSVNSNKRGSEQQANNQSQVQKPREQQGKQGDKSNVTSVSAVQVPKVDSTRAVSKEEMNKKSNLIKDKLKLVQESIHQKPVSQAPSVDDNVQKALLEGMKIIARERPTNPIRALGTFLMNYQISEEKQLRNPQYGKN